MKLETRVKKYLKAGDEFENFKLFCKQLHIDPAPRSNSKKHLIKELSYYMDFCKLSPKNTIRVNQIYETPLVDVERYNQPQFTPTKKEGSKIGVYIITNGEESYIGSTIAGFYKRFLRHYENSGNTHQKTYNLLHNGGEFRILKAMPSSSSEKEVRDMEKYYIDKYLKAGKKLLNSENSSPIVLAAKGKDKRRKQDSLSQDPNVEKEYNKYIKMSKRQNKNKKTVYKK